MRGFAAVLGREIHERRLLAVVALALGLMPLTLPLMPGLLPGGFSIQDLRSGLAFGLAMLLTGLLALFLGGSIIAADLAERRLGFYFARPLSGAAIWAGKTAAALLLVAGSGVIVLLPSVLLGIDANPFDVQAMGKSWTDVVAIWGLALLGLLLAAHAASLIVRSRSPWILLDLAALGVVAGLCWTTWRRLILAGVGAAPVYWGWHYWADPRQWMTDAIFLVALPALALAGALQVIKGRTDLRRGHRVLSLSLWGTLLAAAVLLTGFSIWGISGGPSDLRRIWQATGAPRGSWVAVVGPSARMPGYQPGFLYDLSSGRFFGAGFGAISNGFDPEVRFSADGRRAVWLAYEGAPYRSPVVVFRLDLDRPGAAPVRTQISYQGDPRTLALSADGRRIAVFHGYSTQELTVEEVDTGRLLAAVHPDLVDPRLIFADPDHLRVYSGSFGDDPQPAGEKAPDIFEIDLTSTAPKLEPTGHLPRLRGFPGLALSPAGDRALLRSPDGLGLIDARTGEVLAPIGDRRSSALFLADGRIAALGRIAGGRELRVLAPDGRSELRRFAFPGARDVVVADQPAPGLLRVVVSLAGAPSQDWEVRLLDLASGGSRPLGTRKLLHPVAVLFAGQSGLSRARSPRLSLEQAGGVVWFDVLAFQERVVLKNS
ncbi:MAG TPA: hypothetical protein VGH73_10875 [Thermoanaerobaculia bacterium]|jgi:hypothetical protein